MTVSKENSVSVIIIGGGQAGLSCSYYLTEKKIDHLIFERNKIFNKWQEERWDSFCLVTPNWQCNLPDYPYQGREPKGYMSKADLLDYLHGFAKSFDPPVREGVSVEMVSAVDQDNLKGYQVETSDGVYFAENVIVAIGPYHSPRIPQFSKNLPDEVQQLHSSEYKNPEQVPPGEVLVVGTGQSGCQIAEDLHFVGKKVHLCVGSAPRSPRMYRDRDVTEWLNEMGHYDLPVTEYEPEDTNHYLTGRDGGREIDLRKLALEGMQLHGRLTGVENGMLTFDEHLSLNLDNADKTANKIRTMIDNYITEAGIKARVEDHYSSIWQPADNYGQLPVDLQEANIRSVIWCTGFHTHFNFIDQDIFEEDGLPKHERGVTAIAGLFFIGLPWLYTWGSGRLASINRDAAFLADQITKRRSAVLI